MRSGLKPPEGPDIVEFATSKSYLNKDYFSLTQISILKSIYGLQMSREELLAYLQVTDGRKPRKGGYQEAAIICGVRSGKTELGALILTYECCRWLPVLHTLLPPGKCAKGIIIAHNERGAREAREYVEGNLNVLHEKYGNILANVDGQQKAITGRSIRLNSACEIVIYPSKKAAVRSVTGLCFIGDEVAFWEAAEGAYDQDEKVMRAVRSRFATLSRLRPKRILISSPDEEEGVLFDAWKHRGDRPGTLVVNAPSWILNPSIEQSFLDVEQEKDPEGFMSEYGGQFRRPGGGNSFLQAASIDSCVERGRIERRPAVGVEYVAWMDAAFKRDRFSFGIGHSEHVGDDVIVFIDLMKHWTPRSVPKRRKAQPLDDRKVIAEIVSLMRPYGLDRIYGDQFADIPLKNTFAREHGIQFVESPVSSPEKIDAFKNLRAALRGRLVCLTDDPIMVKDLKSLVRRTTSGGHVTIAAPSRKGSYDDAANVVARIVRKLLPIDGGLDLRALNSKALDEKSDHPGIDWVPESGSTDAGLDSAFLSVGGMIL